MYRSSALYKSIKLKVDIFSSQSFFFFFNVILQLCYFGFFLLLNMFKDEKKQNKKVSVCLSNSYNAKAQKPPVDNEIISDTQL